MINENNSRIDIELQKNHMTNEPKDTKDKVAKKYNDGIHTKKYLLSFLQICTSIKRFLYEDK